VLVTERANAKETPRVGDGHIFNAQRCGNHGSSYGLIFWECTAGTWSCGDLFGLLLGDLLDALQLVVPVALKCGGPLVEGADGFSVGAVELVATGAADVNQAYIAQNAEMLGDGRLVELKVGDDVADWALAEGEIREDLPAARFGNGVKSVGGGSGSCHEQNNTFLYGNMSREYFTFRFAFVFG
jgi:hypothetical protein